MTTAHRCGLALASLLVALAPGSGLAQQGAAAPQVGAPRREPPLLGPSILRGLALTVEMSPLGRLGGEGAPPEARIPAAFVQAVRKAVPLAGRDDDAALKALRASFQVDGATIYRLDCRACHGPEGAGKPPAVASIIGSSKALSVAHHEEVMIAAGAKARPELSAQLAQQADQALRQRLSEGGKPAKLPNLEVMPAFAHLSEAEILALEGYLQQLAKAPRTAATVLTATESALRVGEHVVRGTCRICHDATGPGAGHAMMMAGLVPALVGMTEQLSLAGVVHKVRHGWAEVAGAKQNLSRMPVYPYLSDEEVEAAYLYLAYLPPGR
jgi:mono/diheme cytochrome c family protein